MIHAGPCETGAPCTFQGRFSLGQFCVLSGCLLYASVLFGRVVVFWIWMWGIKPNKDSSGSTYPSIVAYGPKHHSEHGTVDDRNLASAYIHIDVLYYHSSFIFGIKGLYEVMQEFYHQKQCLHVEALETP